MPDCKPQRGGGVLCSDWLDAIVCGDCLNILSELPDKSVDAIITDPPYGVTGLHWDTKPDQAQMWRELKRVAKPLAAIVIFATEPFASELRLANREGYKYDWVWDKVAKGDVMNAKNKPMRQHEMLCVFSDGTTANGSERKMRYYPQGVTPNTREVNRQNRVNSSFKQLRPSHAAEYQRQGENYPSTILTYSNADHTEAYHPTQKPVALMRYLIETYTLPGETVLDPFSGSGSTLVAAKQTGRHYIGIEKEKHYVEITKSRLHQELSLGV